MTQSPHPHRLEKELIKAIAAKDRAGVARALAAGADADARLHHESLPVFLAVRTEDPEIVRLVAAAAKDLDHADDCDFTAFTYAVRMNRPKIAGILLEAGASPFPPGRGADYPLSWALQNNLYGLVGRMLEIDGTAERRGAVLHQAARGGDAALAEICLREKDAVNFQDKIQGNTVLHLTAFSGSESMVRLFLNAGADTGLKNKAGQTPVDVARKGGRHSALHIILTHEAQRAAALFTAGTPRKTAVRKPLRLTKTATGRKRP
jgi:ankyrin repeat protein